jgi:uncharacterized membrane protein
MSTEYKVLGQAAPSAETPTPLYTVPSDTSAVTSTITIANRGATAATYRIAVRKNGDTLENKHYVAFGTQVLANDTIAVTIGITARATDIIEVYASNGDLSFNLFGSEIAD